jgi:hypothetical protein
MGVFVIACAGAVAACGTLAAHAPTPAVTSPAAHASSPASAPTAPASTAPASTAPPVTAAHTPSAPPTTVNHSTTCRASAFSAAPVNSEGAMGSRYYTVTVTNHGATCTLTGQPVLYDTLANGDVVRIPYAHTPATGAPESVVLHQGQSADMAFRTPDGYGGYDPGSADCAHPALYRHVSVGVGTGRVALANFELSVKCDGVTLWYFWSRN